MSWLKEDAITYHHKPSGCRIVKMNDNTWSTCTGPVENISIGLAHWISHKYKTLRLAKSAICIRNRRMTDE